MNKLSKIIGWVLGIIGIALGIWCFASGVDSTVDIYLKYTYFLLIAAVVILILLAIFMTAKNNPKGLLWALVVLAGIAALVGVTFALSSGAPAVNVKQQPSEAWLKLTDTMLMLSYILGCAAVVAIIFGAIRGALNNK